MIYLDNAATTPIASRVFKEMLPYLIDEYGNPSSPYALGRNARAAIEKARGQIAIAIHAEPRQIFFTSGATESNNIVMRAYDHTVCSNVEHPSIKGTEFNIFGNYEVTIPDIINSIREAKSRSKIVVSTMLVNNETGAIFPVREIADIAHANGASFHTDASQAFGHIKIDVEELDCDFMTIAPHKFFAPKGVGILFVKNPDIFKSDVIGGGQEKGIRGGTENVAAIVGAGYAADLYRYVSPKDKVAWNMYDYLTNLLVERVKRDFRINRDTRFKYIPQIVSLSVKNVEAESVLLLLDNKDICVSAGSACHSGDLSKSRILSAMGVSDDYAYGTIRISFSEFNNKAELDLFVTMLARILRTI